MYIVQLTQRLFSTYYLTINPHNHNFLTKALTQREYIRHWKEASKTRSLKLGVYLFSTDVGLFGV
jgi:hypothetical protein